MSRLAHRVLLLCPPCTALPLFPPNSESDSDCEIVSSSGYGAHAKKKRAPQGVSSAGVIAAPAAAAAAAAATQSAATGRLATPKAPPQKVHPPAAGPPSNVSASATSHGSAKGPPASRSAVVPPPPLNLMSGWQAPRGSPGCLTGTVFVLSGDLPHLTRSKAEALITDYGGRHTGVCGMSMCTLLLLRRSPSPANHRVCVRCCIW